MGMVTHVIRRARARAGPSPAGTIPEGRRADTPVMDLGNTGLLISGLIVGAVGMGVFLYGKKQGNLKCIAVGLGMSIFP